MKSGEITLPTCPLCEKPVFLETAKTDENGNAIHEDCYLLKVRDVSSDRQSSVT
jgi:hypothetical protein